MSYILTLYDYNRDSLDWSFTMNTLNDESPVFVLPSMHLIPLYAINTVRSGASNYNLRLEGSPLADMSAITAVHNITQAAPTTSSVVGALAPWRFFRWKLTTQGGVQTITCNFGMRSTR
jgi:hypothetical protein